jgi:hypothetical protein
MRFACWITKAANIHSEYVILIAFPRQKWLRERALILRYIYIACIVVITLAVLKRILKYYFEVLAATLKIRGLSLHRFMLVI